MSKQEHDQDEQRAPSGAGKGESPGDAAKEPATDKGAAAQSGSGQSASTPEKNDKGEGADTAKPAKPDANRPVTGSTPSGATKGQDAKPGKSQDAKPEPAKTGTGSNGPAKPGGKPKETDSKPVPGSTTATPGGGSAGTAAPRRAGGHSGGSGGKAGIAALVLVILLALIAALAGWWGWQKLQAQQARLSQLSQVQSSTSDNADAIEELRSQLSGRDQQRQQAVQDLRNEMQQYRQEVNQTLDDVLAKLAEEQETDPNEWLFSEVEYLLRLANQRLQLERDVNGAISLLRTADERLAQADNPALTPVRRAIQSELGELQSVPNIDRTGLYLQLMAQQQQLAKLPLQQDIEQIAAEGGDTSTVEGAWQQQLSRLWQEIKELVVVRRHDQALEALMTPEQESYLRQNVRLQLEQAQLALLQANPELYRASLEKAITLIEGYYDTDSDGVQQVLDTLRSLMDKTIRPELPDISESLQALRDFMTRRQGGGNGDA
ncbi:uroporphyrinogen-III C-methyltransferase [Halomonas sp. McH1-25]|uniref:uroporphyrinogen-III C-methyltransferase n=1 Tax=unclassified Halomonas TaxID=2609666 RepID=UPI001EF6AF78|nr:MULTISPECIES: uroporphyrinogen-III C-methyltransferase [unclassified Halomonas]MCG7599471.1 uroporphyrinogen-III C-methyltransferase [Halomonas sp. McH1-25]MCP1342858.1 uroporphyrinogen-III C-methyltransferase [Halomonas sp. FL8]MCP1361957.1 uroporphyrinogen-III C-methyltransferase [Halomonas sp. BBD45]